MTTQQRNYTLNMSLLNVALQNQNIMEGADDEILDYSKTKYPGIIKSVPQWEAAIKISCYVILIAVSLVGNSLVLTTICRNRAMRTTTNFYLVNLAVCDLIVTSFSTWVHLVSDLKEGWVLGDAFCRLSSFLQFLSLLASVLTLTLIACDRFFGIVFSMRAHLTDRRPWLFILIVWVASIIIALPLIFHRKQLSRQWLNHLEIWCDDTWVDPSIEMQKMQKYSRVVYYTFISLFLFFVPIFVMSVAYTVIVCKLWSRRTPGDGLEFDPSVQIAAKKKIIKMLTVVLSVFVFCWLPSQITILYGEYRTNQFRPLPRWFNGFQYFSTFLAYSNSAINPIIYTCFSENFRRGETIEADFGKVFAVIRRSFRHLRQNDTSTQRSRIASIENSFRIQTTLAKLPKDQQPEANCFSTARDNEEHKALEL